MPKQQTLFDYQNPILGKLGPKFFNSLPTVPGVYLMKNSEGKVLYVGKAKNLRVRLFSYKNARPDTVSRKVIRMLWFTDAIEIRLCKSETAALLAENKLLRTLRPTYNVINTYPEAYYFISLKKISQQNGCSQLRFVLSADESAHDGKRFGVFKGQKRTSDAFGALLRVLSALATCDEGFCFPVALSRQRPPHAYVLGVPDQVVAPLHRFLQGRSRAFLVQLVELLLDNESIPRFIRYVLTEDLKQLENFYVYGPKRTQKLKSAHGIRRRVVAQDEIDDLIVLNRPQ